MNKVTSRKYNNNLKKYFVQNKNFGQTLKFRLKIEILETKISLFDQNCYF